MDKNEILIIEAAKRNSKNKKLQEYFNNELNPKIFCKFCGRELKNINSKKLGYGKGCYKRWVKSRQHKRSLISG